METVTDFIFLAPKSLQMVTAAMNLKDACSLEERYDQPRQHGRWQNEAGKGVREFGQENALVTANTLFQQHKR